MNTCCKQYELSIAEAGKAGISFIARRLGDHIGIFLQARSYDISQEAKVQGLPKASDPPRPFFMVMQEGIKYCPYCGSDLKSLIETDLAGYNAVVEKHKEFELS